MKRKAPELCSAAADAVVRVGKLADCKLVAADGSSFEVSKAALAIHSNVLGTMLNNIDPAEECVKLDDSAAEVACLVNHSYGGDEYLVDIDNLLGCSRMARKYHVPRLQRAVDDFAKQLELSDDNVARYMAVAHDGPGMPELKDRCIAYAAKRLQLILKLRRADNERPPDWLEALPSSTLIDVMQRRCSIIANRTNTCTRCFYRRSPTLPTSDADIEKLEGTFLV